MENKINLICGEGNINLLEQIGNDPNFVFKNDPNFQTITLYNELGNVININSWLECANYVNGGWVSDKIEILKIEKNFFLILCLILLIYSASKIFLKYRGIKLSIKN